MFIYIYGYGSIPINTIFSGMNIHLPAILIILMWTTGVQGFDTLYVLYVIFPEWVEGEVCRLSPLYVGHMVSWWNSWALGALTNPLFRIRW